MTDVTPPHAHDGAHSGSSHEGPIKTPRQLIIAVLFSFVVPIAVIVLLVKYVGSHNRPGAGSNALAPEVTAQRIAPVGMVQVKDTSDPAMLRTGEQVFGAQCTACHTAGALGAPKFGDASAWAPRLAAGYDGLLHSALAGKGAMPPQGGGDYTDYEIGRAVVYMANKAGGTLKEPEPPAAGASAPDAAMAAAPTPAAAATPATPAPDSAPAPAPAPAATPAAATTVAAAAPAAADAGGAPPALYAQICQACHAAGVAGAPKFGDKAAWAPRLALGIDGLTASAIKGKGAMPPRGGSNAPDADIKAVVTYMVNNAK